MPADYIVNVLWKALPFSDAYYRLHGVNAKAVDDKLSARVEALVPPNQQQQWLNLDLRQTDYGGILTTVNNLIMQQGTPPQGTLFHLSTPEMVQWIPTTKGHYIVYSMQLTDTDGTNQRFWEFDITHGGVVYPARMGVNYECLLNEP